MFVMKPYRLTAAALVLFALTAPLVTAQSTSGPEWPQGASEPLETIGTGLLHIAEDQKTIWTSPLHWKGRNRLLAAAAVLGTTGALLAADPGEARYFRNTTSFDSFNRAFGSRITAYGTVATPVALLAAGMLRHDAKMRNTAMLAGEAAIDAEILTVALKNLTRRSSPGAIPAAGDFSNTWLQTTGLPTLRGNGSFPSGHTISAFAVATVVSRRYRNHRWVPYLAYGLAGAVGFSRVTTSAHFASDAFLGGALGYTIGWIKTGGRLRTPHRKAYAGS